MSQAIQARQVNSEGPQYSSSNVSKKDEHHLPYDTNQLQNLISTPHQVGYLNNPYYTYQKEDSIPENRQFYQHYARRGPEFNQPQRFEERNFTRLDYLTQNKSQGLDLSPIRGFEKLEKQEEQYNRAINPQQQQLSSTKNYQSVTSIIPRFEQKIAMKSVSEYASKYEPEFYSNTINRPQTQRVERVNTERFNYTSDEENKKYRIGSDYETKPHTQRDNANITGLSSLNSSYRKVTNFSITNDTNELPFVRPYSTFNLTSRPQTYNQTDRTRSISLSQQLNQRFLTPQDNRFDKRSAHINLTALESEGIIEEEERYMKTFVDRPYTSYQNQSNYRPQANLSSPNYHKALSNSLNLQQTNIHRQAISDPVQFNISNISQIPRPHYESQFVEKRTLRKLGGSEEPKVVFKNNWCLLGLLFLLLLALMSVGVWFGRDEFLKRHNKPFGPSEKVEEPGVKPTYIDPTQVSSVNTTLEQNQTSANQSVPVTPIQYPPISINITIVTPEVETRNDTILKPEPQKPTLLNTSVLPSQIPIVFPPVQQVNTSVAYNKTEKPSEGLQEGPFEKPTVIEPVVTPSSNISLHIQPINETVSPQTNYTEQPIQPIIPIVIPSANITTDNVTSTNITVPIQPTILPIEPIVIPIEPETVPTNQTKLNQSTTTDTTIDKVTPIIVTPNITIIPEGQNVSNLTVLPSQPNQTVIEKEPGYQYVEAQKFNATDSLEGYAPIGELYYPIQQKIDYSIEPSTSNEFYPEIATQNLSIVEPSQPIIIPKISGVNENSVEPSTSLQFDQIYHPKIQDQDVGDIFVKPTIQPTPTVIPQITPIIPQANLSTLNTSTNQNITPQMNQTQQTIQPQPIVSPKIEPQVVSMTPPAQQKTPSYMSDYIDPQNVSDFEVSVLPITSQVQFSSLIDGFNASAVNTISIEPSLLPSPITQPQNIQDTYIPSTIEIQPAPFYGGQQVTPIATPVDFGTVDQTKTETLETQLIQPEVIPIEIQKPVMIQNVTVPQKPTIPKYIEPQNISDFEISILPQVQSIQSTAQNISDIVPIQIASIQPQIEQPSTFVSPQPIYPTVQPAVIQPQTVSMLQNVIDASKDQTLTIQPQILDNNALQPQKLINLPETIPSKPMQQGPVSTLEQVSVEIEPSTSIEPSLDTDNARIPIEQKPIAIEVKPILPFVIQPTKIIEPIPMVEIEPTQMSPIAAQTIESNQSITLPVEVYPIPTQNSIQPSISINTLNETQTVDATLLNILEVKPSQIQTPEITPTQIQPPSTITPSIVSEQVQITPSVVEPNYIEPQNQQIQSFIEPTTTNPSDIKPTSVIQPTRVDIEIPATIEETSVSVQPTITPSETPKIPALQVPQFEPKTWIISQTNFTDPNEFIFDRVKRITPIDHPEAIYEIPQDYDKSKLPQIEKNFLLFYNKTIQQKSPFEIIPLSWKALKQSTLLTENQYPIFYTHNRTEGETQINYLPNKLPVKVITPYSQNKETILEISPDGKMTVLQKGTDWAQIEETIQTSKNSAIPLSIFPNVKGTPQVVHRHFLRRNS